MKRLFWIFSLSLVCFSPLWAKNSLISKVSFGPVELGESRIPLNLQDFLILKTLDNKEVDAKLIIGSVQWVRTEDNLLTPRARLGININSASSEFHIKYLEQTIVPSRQGQFLYTEIYVNLFAPGDILIYQGKENVEGISIESKKPAPGKQTQVIDYSCSRYQVSIEGLENQYFSLGCRIERLGEWSTGHPRLEITWAATNFRLPDGTSPPYVAYLHDSNPIEMTLVDSRGEKRKVRIKAKLPKRLKRLKTAWGFGPYPFQAKQNELEKNWKITPALFLYGKLDITEDTTTSLKFFNGLLYNGESLFNNAGLYFSYEIAHALDRRISIIPLLGAQLLTFKFDEGFGTNTDVIYPQGFEMVYRHAFGIENYNVVYGMFLPFSTEDKYTNIWLRWGKGYFWELNFIGWEQDGRKSSTYGLSIGLPLSSFF